MTGRWKWAIVMVGLPRQPIKYKGCRRGHSRMKRARELERKWRSRAVEKHKGLKRRSLFEDQIISLSQNHLQCCLWVRMHLNFDWECFSRMGVMSVSHVLNMDTAREHVWHVFGTCPKHRTRANTCSTHALAMSYLFDYKNSFHCYFLTFSCMERALTVSHCAGEG